LGGKEEQLKVAVTFFHGQQADKELDYTTHCLESYWKRELALDCKASIINKTA